MFTTRSHHLRQRSNVAGVHKQPVNTSTAQGGMFNPLRVPRSPHEPSIRTTFPGLSGAELNSVLERGRDAKSRCGLDLGYTLTRGQVRRDPASPSGRCKIVRPEMTPPHMLVVMFCVAWENDFVSFVRKRMLRVCKEGKK